MRIRLIAIGSRMPAWVVAGFDDYVRRLPPELKLELLTIPIMKRGGNASLAQIKAAEGTHILRAAKNARLVAFDEHGTALSTLQWKDALSSWMQDARDVAFAVGGPDGHSQSVLAHAEARWSLSSLTLPHALVRIVVAEQLYRAWSIIANHPYHRG